jgi:hypothetical protein
VTGPRRPSAPGGGVAAFGLATLLVSGCSGPQPQDPVFELRCDPGCGPNPAPILAEMEGVRDSVRLWFGARSAGVTPPRTTRWWRPDLGVDYVRFHGSAESFERVDRRLASGRYRELRAFSHARSRTAHILSELQPQATLWSEWGPGPHGERLAIHEAAHLATYRVAHDARWPAWLAEGVAGRLEEGWSGARAAADPAWPGAGTLPAWHDPWLDTRRRARKAVAASGGIPPTSALLRGGLDGLPLGTRYALWAGFVETLLEPPFRTHALRLFAELAGPAPGGGWTDESVAHRFERHFDAATLAALDARFRERIENEPAGWLELRRAAGLAWTPGDEAAGGPWLIQRPTGTDPMLWRPADAAVGGGGRVPARVRVVAQILFGDPESAGVVVALGTLSGDGIGVIVPAEGAPYPVRVPPHPDRLPVPLPQAPVRSASSTDGANAAAVLARGAVVEIKLELADQTLSLSLGDEPPLRWPAPELHPDGSWGIGTVGRTVARWRPARH